jgi:[acyl-carrier-protein] S-malonyltransferase
MKTAFLFPGQGAQAVGMGADIAATYPAAAEVFSKANNIVGYDLSKLCFEGPAEQLNTTTISQPAIFTASAAILEILRNSKTAENMKPDVTAGLSLGEYTALYAAEVISFSDALKLVQKRGQAMQAAADATDGGMVSVIGLDEEKAAALCAEAAQGGEILAAVNFNCPGQIVLSGGKAACARAEALAGRYGAIKAVRLEVAGAFHSDMMVSAANAVAEALRDCKIAEPDKVKIIANVDAGYYSSAAEIRAGLKAQLTKPVLWQKCMEKLLADGVEKFYEIGPGRVLTGLMKRINRKATVVNVSGAEGLKELIVDN